MTSSDTLIAYIKGVETLQLKAYKADNKEDYYTIGWGHYGPDVAQGQTISEAEAENLLRNDLKVAENCVNNLNIAKTQGEFDALVDFAFNVGGSKLRTSTLVKKIRQGRPTEEILKQFRRWKYCKGKVLNGLVKRREWECQRYVSND